VRATYSFLLTRQVCRRRLSLQVCRLSLQVSRRRLSLQACRRY